MQSIVSTVRRAFLCASTTVTYKVQDWSDLFYGFVDPLRYCVHVRVLRGLFSIYVKGGKVYSCVRGTYFCRDSRVLSYGSTRLVSRNDGRFFGTSYLYSVVSERSIGVLTTEKFPVISAHRPRTMHLTPQLLS